VTVLVGAAVVLVGVIASPGSGQEAQSARLRLVVTHLDEIVGEGVGSESTDATLRVAIDNNGDERVDNVRLVIEVYPQARSRGLLRAALDRDVFTTGPVHVVDAPIRAEEGIGPGEIASQALTIDGGAAGWTGESGVFPVGVSVVRGTEVLDRVVTAVIAFRQAPQTTLDTLVVWPIDEAPWRLSVGRYPAGVDQAVEPRGRLERMLTALEQVPDASVVAAPAAHLLEDLVDRADGFVEVDGSDSTPRPPESPAAVRANQWVQRLRATIASRPVDPYGAPYGDVDVGLMAGQVDPVADIASDAAATGHDRAGDLAGRDMQPGVVLVHERVGQAGIELLPGSTLVIGWDVVEGPDLSLDADLASPVRRVTTDSGRVLTLLVADPYIQLLLDELDVDAGSLVAARRILAESAMVHFEAPGLDDRPLVILPPRDVDLPGNVASRLLRSLAAAPWLTLADANEVRNGADVAPAALRELEPETDLSSDLVEQIAATATLVDGLDATLVRDGTEPVDDPAQLRDDLARASSTWLREDPGARQRAIARIQESANEALGTIEIAAAGVTLTADEGTVPITIRRPEGAPLDVRVRVDAQGRLGWPDGDTSETIRLASTEPQTVSFATIARSRGTFPVVVEITDPSGTLVLHEATISVRSTAISGPAVVVVAAIVVLLVLIGLVRRRPRGSRRARLEVVQDLPGRAPRDDH
jgi:hypothetical protein